MVEIIKEDGTREAFDERKLLSSLSISGAPENLAKDILAHVFKDLREGMKSEDIYAHALNILREKHRPIAAQYSLKRAIMEFGPSGFPFERFIARILEAEGYRTQVGVMVPGKCVTHEVDVVAEKKGERILIEAKFHNTPGTKTDVKVALYVHARFEDIARRNEEKDGEDVFTRAWLITNTTFTSNAVMYGKCSNFLMTGWNHPKGHTLQDLIQRSRVHPVTCLTSLETKHKQELLNRGAVLCKDILAKTDLLRSLGMSDRAIAETLEEGNALCTL